MAVMVITLLTGLSFLERVGGLAFSTMLVLSTVADLIVFLSLIRKLYAVGPPV